MWAAVGRRSPSTASDFRLSLAHDFGVASQQPQRPRQQRCGGIVAGNEHGEQLVADGVVIEIASATSRPSRSSPLSPRSAALLDGAAERHPGWPVVGDSRAGA